MVLKPCSNGISLKSSRKDAEKSSNMDSRGLQNLLFV